MNEDLEFRLVYFDSKKHVPYLQSMVDELIKVCRPTVQLVAINLNAIENGEDDTAYILGDGFEFEVFIDSRMPLGMITDYIIHEISHADSWWVGDDEEDHCDEFGKSYAKLYRKYLEFYDDWWSQ